MSFNNISYRLLNSLVDAAPLAIFDLDREGRVKNLWNEAAVRIFGWSKQEVVGERLSIVPEDSQQQFDELRAKVFNGEAFTNLELKRQRKDQSLIDVSVSTAPMRDESDHIVGIMSVVADISERKQVERTLRHNEKKFREIFNNANDAIYLHKLTEEGRPGQFVEVNDIACEMLGYTKEEFYSMSPKDLDAGEEATKVPDIMKQLLATGHHTFEMVHEAKNGQHIPVELSSHLFEIGGEERVLTIARDITDRKHAEKAIVKNQKRLENALRAENLAWWEMELPSGQVTFNDRKATMLGYSPDKFSHYKDFTHLIHPDDHQQALQAMKSHLEGENERYEIEYRIQKSNGNYKWYRDIGKITDSDGEYKKVTGIVIDIDERKGAEKELKKEREKLRKLHGAVDRFQTCQTEQELCKAATEASQQVLGFDLCTFYCLEDNQLVPIATNSDKELAELPTHKMGEGLAGKSLEDGETLWGEDITKVETAAPDKPGLKSYMSVPIKDIGVLQAGSEMKGVFNKSDIEMAEVLAGHLGEEVKRIRLQHRLKEEATRDPLTGLYNRRYFNETFQQEVERSTRYGSPLSFLMIDINRFKEINDRYSHQVGDKILTQVANLLQENVRSSDTVVRYGGDEFLVLLPETDGEAVNTAKRLHQQVSRWNEASSILDFPLTLAIGISEWKPEQDKDVEEALKEADKQMYINKRSE